MAAVVSAPQGPKAPKPAYMAIMMSRAAAIIRCRSDRLSVCGGPLVDAPAAAGGAAAAAADAFECFRARTGGDSVCTSGSSSSGAQVRQASGQPPCHASLPGQPACQHSPSASPVCAPHPSTPCARFLVLLSCPCPSLGIELKRALRPGKERATHHCQHNKCGYTKVQAEAQRWPPPVFLVGPAAGAGGSEMQP